MITEQIVDKIKPGLLVSLVASDEWTFLKHKCGKVCDTAQLFSHKAVTVAIDDAEGEPIVVRRRLNEIALHGELEPIEALEPMVVKLLIPSGERIISLSVSYMACIGKYLCVDYMLYNKTCCVFSKPRKSKNEIVLTFTPDKKLNGKNVIVYKGRIPLYFRDVMRKFGIADNVRKFRIVSAVSAGNAVKITLQPIVDQPATDDIIDQEIDR